MNRWVAAAVIITLAALSAYVLFFRQHARPVFALSKASNEGNATLISQIDQLLASSPQMPAVLKARVAQAIALSRSGLVEGISVPRDLLAFSVPVSKWLSSEGQFRQVYSYLAGMAFTLEAWARSGSPYTYMLVYSRCLAVALGIVPDDAAAEPVDPLALALAKQTLTQSSSPVYAYARMRLAGVGIDINT